MQTKQQFATVYEGSDGWKVHMKHRGLDRAKHVAKRDTTKKRQLQIAQFREDGTFDVVKVGDVPAPTPIRPEAKATPKEETPKGKSRFHALADRLEKTVLELRALGDKEALIFNEIASLTSEISKASAEVKAEKNARSAA